MGRKGNLHWYINERFVKTGLKDCAITALEEMREKMNDNIYEMIYICLTQDGSQEKKWVEG